MGKTLYLDCTNGISGDMTVAALLDAGANEARLRDALASLPLDGYEVRISRVKKAGIDCCDFDVVLDEAHENHDHDMRTSMGATTTMVTATGMITPATTTTTMGTAMRGAPATTVTTMLTSTAITTIITSTAAPRTSTPSSMPASWRRGRASSPTAWWTSSRMPRPRRTPFPLDEVHFTRWGPSIPSSISWRSPCASTTST